MSDWYDKHRERIAAKTDQQHAVALAEAWGKHLACGAIFDSITKWMDQRGRTAAELDMIIVIREMILAEMRKAGKERDLLRDMQLCRMQPKDEDWGGVA